MKDDRTDFVLFFDVGDRWEGQRRERKRERRQTGRTSIAVSKETAVQLRALAARLRIQGGWSIGFLSLDELLSAIAKGELAIVTPAGRKAWRLELQKQAPEGKPRRARGKDMQNGEDRS